MAHVRLDVSDPHCQTWARDVLLRGGHMVTVVQPGECGAGGVIDVIVADPVRAAMHASATRDAALIVVDAEMRLGAIRDAVRLGATDYLVLPDEQHMLLPAVARAAGAPNSAKLELELDRVSSVAARHATASMEYFWKAHRWEIVARIAEVVAKSRDYGAIMAVLRDAIGGDPPLRRIGLIEMTDHGGELVACLSSDGVRVPQGLKIGPEQMAQLPTSLLGTGASISVALSSAGEQVGRLFATRGDDAPFEPSEIELLNSVGPHIAHAIGNVRHEARRAEVATLKDRMSMLLVHDIKNPLSVIKVNLELLREDAGFAAEEQTELLDDAIGATDRVLGMLVDLLDIGLAEERGIDVMPNDILLEPWLADVVAHHRHLGRSRSISLQLDISPGLSARVDPKLFRRVVENILNNGLRYSPVGGVITLRARQEGTGLSLQVDNDGPPIPAAVLARLFHRYGATDSTARQYGNRGLGLYLCRLVVEAHEGTISVRNRDGGGVRFDIFVPRKAAHR